MNTGIFSVWIFICIFYFQIQESRCAVKTTSGELCVFPFYYNKKLYYSCTTVDYENKLWCATSFNYNRDNKWGDCDTTRGPHCTVSSTTRESCVFPFYYKGKQFTSCTTVDNGNKLWCATTRNYERDGKWGDCDVKQVARCINSSIKGFKNKVAETECVAKTTSGKPCVFPFYYNKKWFQSCTSVDYGKLWCATSSSYDRDNRWGDCEITSGSECKVNTTSGELCVFPFYYKKQRYQTCTTVDNGNTYWCATKRSNYDVFKNWGVCDLSQVARCLKAPCFNGGTCRNIGDSYKCVCSPGFHGSRCEIEENVLQRK